MHSSGDRTEEEPSHAALALPLPKEKAHAATLGMSLGQKCKTWPTQGARPLFHLSTHTALNDDLTTASSISILTLGGVEMLGECPLTLF